jgi:hypothetical protein
MYDILKQRYNTFYDKFLTDQQRKDLRLEPEEDEVLTIVEQEEESKDPEPRESSSH